MQKVSNSQMFVQDESQLKAQETELKRISDILVKLQEKSEEDAKSVKCAQDHFHAVSAGLSSNEDGQDQTLADQLLGTFRALFIGDNQWKINGVV